MPRFSFKARDADGRPVEGVVEAVNASAVAEQLQNAGVTPLDITAARGAGASGVTELLSRLRERRPSLSDLMLFSRQVYALTKAGVPITRGLGQLAPVTRNAMLGEAIDDIVDELETGRDLSSAMGRHPRIFNALFVNMVRVGEESGRLEESFLRMYEHQERELRTVNQIKTALRYPAFVVLAIVIAISVLMTVVIPAFAKVYSSFDLELPLPTRIIIAVAGFFEAYWPLLLIAAVAGVFGFRAYIRSDRGGLWWDRTKLRIPVVGNIILRGTLARFGRAFAMASRAGVPVLQGLNVVSRAVGNEHVGRKIVQMREGIERGESLTRTAANTGIFTRLVLQMIAVGEETGQVDDMLEEVAEFYEREVDYDVKHLNDLIQPLLTVVLAALVLVLALGVFLPMWDLTQIAGR